MITFNDSREMRKSFHTCSNRIFGIRTWIDIIGYILEDHPELQEIVHGKRHPVTLKHIVEDTKKQLDELCCSYNEIKDVLFPYLHEAETLHIIKQPKGNEHIAYLHGDLQYIANFPDHDIAYIEGWEDEFPNGMFPCKVEGVDEKCMGFFWEATLSDNDIYTKKNGLIVLESDNSHLRDAAIKMCHRTYRI